MVRLVLLVAVVGSAVAPALIASWAPHGEPPAGVEGATAGTLRTRAPGARLPSPATCARRVRRHGIEAWPANERENQTTGRRIVLPRGAWRHFPRWRRLARRIDGHFTGTTDEILQWASCKWGFDENLTRAQAYVESRWQQDFRGDGRQSVGVLQVKAGTSGAPHRYTWPLSRTSTAFNVDYALGWRRACYEGLFADGGWLPRRSRGDLWGCIGVWYSGAWHERDAGYVANVQRQMRERPWRMWTDGG
ncbi:MAG TPA: hypothetical protein VGJ70_21450 [Solirubrobacteraceae bacterium]